MATRKSIQQIIADEAGDKSGFKRTLTAWDLTLLGVGGIVGAGIFVLTGQAAAQYAGPAVVLSFILSGIACVFAALCYAELAAMIPVAGSAYTYAYATLGQFWAWVIGWDLILEYLFGASTVSVGWSGYVISFLKDFGINFPAALSSSPFVFHHDSGTWQATGALFNLPAALICLACTVLLVIGTRESTWFNNLIVVIKLTVIGLFIAFGASYVSTANWIPFIPENTGSFGQYGWSGVFRGAAVIFFAYIGFDSLSTLSQETKDPQRDMPRGILWSLAIVTVLYIAVSLVMTGIVPYKQLNSAAPIAVAIDAAGPDLFWLARVIKIGTIAGLSSVILLLIMGQPRIFYSMSKDGLLPAWFSKMHPRYGTPYITTIITGVLAAVIAGTFPIGILGELVSIGTLAAFIIVCIGVWVLRRTDPHLDRPFRCPWVPIVPILGALSALAQMVALPPDTWIRLIVWLVIGLVIYFAYSSKHSKVSQ